MDNEVIKKYLDKYIESIKEDLINISKYIHGNPELSFKEYKASAMLVKYLKNNGFNVRTAAGGLETAFVATFENISDKINIGLLAEYDALQDIGHGCGHNLICTSSVGAGVMGKRSVRRS